METETVDRSVFIEIQELRRRNAELEDKINQQNRKIASSDTSIFEDKIKKLREDNISLRTQIGESKLILQQDLKLELMCRIRTQGIKAFMTDFVRAHEKVKNVFSPSEYLGGTGELVDVFNEMEKEIALKFFLDHGHLIPERNLLSTLVFGGISGDIDINVLKALGIDAELIGKIEKKQKKDDKK